MTTPIRSPSPTVMVQSSTPSQEPLPSVRKILSQLLSIPTNRSCAECRSPLVDSSRVFVSLSPLGDPAVAASIPETPLQAPAVRSFKFHHDFFAPSAAKEEKRPQKKVYDPAIRAIQLTGGHGVFLCHACAAAHKMLGTNIALVRSADDTCVWTQKRVQFLANAGGNARSWEVFEAYMPESWQSRRPTNKSTLADREVFCRAKYQVLAFLIPPGGPLSSNAWERLLSLENKKDMERWNEANNLDKFDLLTISEGPDTTGIKGRELPLPLRLVDYFCVVGHGSQLTPDFDHKSVKTLFSPDQLSLEPVLVDCYPKLNSIDDMDFPEHISKFVFPDGVHPLEGRVPPRFFTFVLTTSTGVKLYGAALTVYDESMETEDLIDVLDVSGYDGALPPFLIDENQSSDIVFLPKCLVVISHYAFFNSMRSFLIQLFRISLVGSPLPIERYIANYVSEIPLPPQGKVEIKFGFTSDSQWSISRPAPNKLPIADFSYRPLFAALSTENIMIVIGCLLEETPVALMCGHYSILTPVAEALLSLLFPFEWQGIYLPIMPYSMHDILDAPVPFLVGLHSRYLTRKKPSQRPKGVVFVDLDADVVHLGFDGDGFGDDEPRQTPALPERDAAKLKAKLHEFGSVAYIVPELRDKDKGVTSGAGDFVLNEDREAYAQKSYFYSTCEGVNRAKFFAKADEAFWEEATSAPITSFSSEQGQTTAKTLFSNGKPLTKNPFRKKSAAGKTGSRNAVAGHLLDVRESNGFSSSEIRSAFLRFFVTIFMDYETFLVNGGGSELFRREDFLKNFDNFYSKFGVRQHEYLGRVVASQMFQRFLELRLVKPDDPDVLFFDESILEKRNRSKKKTLSTGKKKTPFLDDKSGEISETCIPAPPSNWGLPDDGRQYSYGSFPKLDHELIGKVRPPKPFFESSKSVRALRHQPSSKVLRKQNELFAKAMKPLAPMALMANSIGSIAKKMKDVEWAIFALSYRNMPQAIVSGQSSSPQQSIVKKEASSRSQNSDRQSARSEDENSLPDAQDLIISALRKQGILLEEITKIQATVRMFLVRKHMGGHRVSFSTGPRAETEIEAIDKLAMNAIVIQRHARALRAREEFLRARHAIAIIQSKGRQYRARKRFLVQKQGVVRAQALFRSRRARFIFVTLKSLVSKVQAIIRGYLTRQLVKEVVKKRMTAYRVQMVELWGRTFTPLSYRSKFWPLITGLGYMPLSLAEEELLRLFIELDVKSSKSTNEMLQKELSMDHLILKKGEGVGMSTSVYKQFLEVEGILESGKEQAGADVMPVFPAESLLSERRKFLTMASEREELEKVQIYEKLDNWTDKEKLNSFYSMFKISPNEKEKKIHAIDAIWRSHTNAQHSVELMLALFPELKASNDIHWVKPSKKAMKRFHIQGSFLPKPLDNSMFVQSKIEKRINANIRELAVAHLGPRRISSKQKEKKSTKAWLRQRNAIMKVRRYKIWFRCRHDLIIEFLYL